MDSGGASDGSIEQFQDFRQTEAFSGSFLAGDAGNASHRSAALRRDVLC